MYALCRHDTQYSGTVASCSSWARLPGMHCTWWLPGKYMLLRMHCRSGRMKHWGTHSPLIVVMMLPCRLNTFKTSNIVGDRPAQTQCIWVKATSNAFQVTAEVVCVPFPTAQTPSTVSTLPVPLPAPVQPTPVAAPTISIDLEGGSCSS
jgi:hypothetical protein